MAQAEGRLFSGTILELALLLRQCQLPTSIALNMHAVIGRPADDI